MKIIKKNLPGHLCELPELPLLLQPDLQFLVWEKAPTPALRDERLTPPEAQQLQSASFFPCPTEPAQSRLCKGPFTNKPKLMKSHLFFKIGGTARCWMAEGLSKPALYMPRSNSSFRPISSKVFTASTLLPANL